MRSLSTGKSKDQGTLQSRTVKEKRIKAPRQQCQFGQTSPEVSAQEMMPRWHDDLVDHFSDWLYNVELLACSNRTAQGSLDPISLIFFGSERVESLGVGVDPEAPA